MKNSELKFIKRTIDDESLNSFYMFAENDSCTNQTGCTSSNSNCGNSGICDASNSGNCKNTGVCQ